MPYSRSGAASATPTVTFMLRITVGVPRAARTSIGRNAQVRRRDRSAAREAALGDLGAGGVRLLQSLDTQLALHGRDALELDVAVVDDLDAVAPRVQEVESPAASDLSQPLRLDRRADRLLVVDDQAEVAAVVGRLGPPLRDRQELVAHVDERRPAPAAAQLEAEKAPVQLERRLDVADLERHVVDADQARHRQTAASARRSSAESSQAAAATFASTCSGRIAPAITEGMPGCDASPAMASSSSVWPCSRANASNASTRSNSSSVSWCARAAIRVPSGGASPRRNLPLSAPLASGKYGT